MVFDKAAVSLPLASRSGLLRRGESACPVSGCVPCGRYKGLLGSRADSIEFRHASNSFNTVLPQGVLIGLRLLSDSKLINEVGRDSIGHNCRVSVCTISSVSPTLLVAAPKDLMISLTTLLRCTSRAVCAFIAVRTRAFPATSPFHVLLISW